MGKWWKRGNSQSMITVIHQSQRCTNGIHVNTVLCIGSQSVHTCRSSLAGGTIIEPSAFFRHITLAYTEGSATSNFGVRDFLISVWFPRDFPQKWRHMWRSRTTVRLRYCSLDTTVVKQLRLLLGLAQRRECKLTEVRILLLLLLVISVMKSELCDFRITK